jgi:hypothetical protein
VLPLAESGTLSPAGGEVAPAGAFVVLSSCARVAMSRLASVLGMGALLGVSRVAAAATEPLAAGSTVTLR